MDNHPYCHESYKNVIATIYKKVNNKPGQPKNFVTEEPYDFYINLKSPFLSWSPQSDEHTILLRKMCKQYNRFNFFLKVGVTEKIDGRTTVTHVFLIYVECRDNLLTKICVVDTAPFAEFNTPHRIINTNVCNGCWNDTSVRFDAGNWNWCPRDKDFICSKEIIFLLVMQLCIIGIMRMVPWIVALLKVLCRIYSQHPLQKLI